MTERNLLRQFDLLQDFVEVGLVVDFKINEHIVCALHAAATTHLVDTPGRYRVDDVHISYSPHRPPAPQAVPNLMGDYFVDLHRNWDRWDPVTLAAYALWRLTWIHPFEDANGRVARAVAFLVLCLKFQRWIIGGPAFIRAIKDHASEYQDALRSADAANVTSQTDVSALALLLARLLYAQTAAALDGGFP